MAAHERSPYIPRSYAEPQSNSNVFYQSEVKKDSEIQLSEQQAQELLRKAEIHAELMQHQQMMRPSIPPGSYPYSSVPPSSSVDSQPKDLVTSQKPSSSSQESLPQPSTPHSSVSSPEADTSSLDQVNKVIQAQSDDYKRLSQSDKAHVCLTCYKGFRNKPQLTQHELVHNNIRKHVCTYCDKSFKQVCHLNQHIRVHTGERPYKCDVLGCGRSFAQLSNLNHHKKNHEEHVKRDVARQFRCDVCDRSYATHQSLNTHIQKLHTNLKAPEGSVSSPIITPMPGKKRRKSSTKSGNAASNIHDTFSMESLDDSGDLDLPTQVKVKPRYLSASSPKSNSLMVRIGTPPENPDRDTKVPRTTLPLPLAFTQGSMEMRGQQIQGHGQDSYIPVMSNSLVTNPHYPHIVVDSLPTHIYSQPPILMSHAQHPSNSPILTPSRSDILHDQHQRELMQARLDDNSDKGYVPIKQEIQPHSSYSPSLQQSLPEKTPTHTHSQRISSETPSHLAHHYPKQETPAHHYQKHDAAPSAHHYQKQETAVHSPQRTESQHIFNPAFSSHDRHEHQSNRYASNQY